MIINGIEFDFSTLNANDVDRMLAAQTRQQERARTEGSRYTPRIITLPGCASSAASLWTTWMMFWAGVLLRSLGWTAATSTPA
ncbi:MAG: hypothetical protein ACLRRU_09350 [Faecalibacterium sp.]